MILITGPFFVQIFRGLAYIHTVPRVCHRDLKPQNLLVCFYTVKWMLKDVSCYLKSFLAVYRLILLLTRLSFVILEVQKCWYADLLLVCISSSLHCVTATLKLKAVCSDFFFRISAWFLTKRDINAVSANSCSFRLHEIIKFWKWKLPATLMECLMHPCLISLLVITVYNIIWFDICISLMAAMRNLVVLVD
jgi:serine/threonine protein kinase